MSDRISLNLRIFYCLNILFYSLHRYYISDYWKFAIMAADLGNEIKSQRTKPKFHMVSELDYKIIALERCETLSTMEKNRLESLRQQKVLRETLGLHILKTKKVPVEWVDSISKSTKKGKTELELEEVEEGVRGAVAENMNLVVTEERDKVEEKKIGEKRQEDMEEKIIEVGLKRTKTKSEAETFMNTKQSFANAYLQFLKEKKALLRLEDPRAALDLASIRKEWKDLENKEPYKKLAQEEKTSLGENFRKNIKTSKLTDNEMKKHKKDYDKTYRAKLKLRREQKVAGRQPLNQKFKDVLTKKEEQLSKQVNMNESIKLNICELKLENSVASRMIEEKDEEISKLKDQYRVLHKLHKTCTIFKKV